jgi:hypothetical protein
MASRILTPIMYHLSLLMQIATMVHFGALYMINDNSK